ncbi:selenium metabolism-associated LysR family transcriptional regulator [Fonticella tunisiensis]|uniref:DNA-binding transcriptional LysR family regulator n=1 Tax=Fonticella tunisiensis TaxID=1096341 RepID=A0A4R7KUH3_9CLOT|nr:selenium metabolism-associated LysR family transcriptional regulator [Fonticella tunisiensis]TDT63252.1 DNA-binding transcriptional LysR family regulator [Fonticella tunisiensis]
MDFKQIEAFINVAKYRSFSKAAEAIYLSQPTVSAHISSLENELNVNLFDRSGKEVKLTYAGSVFLEYAINLINIRNSAITTLADLDNKISGKLVIASSTTPCRFLLPSILSSFHNDYSNVTFDIKEESTRNVIDLILSGNADIGIVGEIIHDNKLSYVKIGDDKLVLISNNKELPENIAFDRLLKEKFILRDKGSATRNVFEKSLELHGISLNKLNIFAEVSSLEAVLQLVKYNVGVSIVSELACQDYIKAGLIRKHNVINFNITRGIYLVAHNKRTLSPSTKAFYQHVVSKLINNNS